MRRVQPMAKRGMTLWASAPFGEHGERPRSRGPDQVVMTARATRRPNDFIGAVMNKALYETGLKIRKEVLGEAYVANATASADEFNKPLQDLVTEYCWGALWGRDGLDRKTRSLINLAMLSALNRSHEFRTHVKGALRNGATKDEIREVLLQVSIYCGVPAGVEAFRIARDVFASEEQ